MAKAGFEVLGGIHECFQVLGKIIWSRLYIYIVRILSHSMEKRDEIFLIRKMQQKAEDKHERIKTIDLMYQNIKYDNVYKYAFVKGYDEALKTVLDILTKK